MSNLFTTLKLWAFALFKIPLIAYCRPQIISLDDKACELKVPLNYFTKNHLGSMYFGALSIGADAIGGVMAMHQIEASGHRIQFVFKDFKAEFLRRPEDDVHFYCEEGHKIKSQIAQTIKTGERVTRVINVVARTPKKSNEVVARFFLGLSLKKK
ncbi:MAG: DUF4442 domain-containing protein [Deltaproteobacteria bacterium]|nr:DUF4442 domain-containing protein [Deltaproteobacteria bacterium]